MSQPPARPPLITFDEYSVCEYREACCKAVGAAQFNNDIVLTSEMSAEVEVQRWLVKQVPAIEQDPAHRIDVVLSVKQKVENANFENEMETLKETISGSGYTPNNNGREDTDGFEIDFRIGKCV